MFRIYSHLKYVTSVQNLKRFRYRISKKIKPSRPGGDHGKPLNFHKSSGRPGDKLEVRGECLPPAAGGTPKTPPKSFKLESLLWPNHGYIRPALVPRHGLGAWQTGLGAGRPGTEHSRIRSGSFLRKGIELSNTVS